MDLDNYDEYREQLNQQADPFNLSPTSVMSNVAVSSVQPVVASNVVDIKQYSIFNEDILAWPKFKRKVIFIAIMHSLDNFFDENHQVPSFEDPGYTVYQEKSNFVYSIWVSRINAGLAYTVIREFEKERDGREVYMMLLQFYEVIMAMNRLNKLYLNYNSSGDTYLCQTI